MEEVPDNPTRLDEIATQWSLLRLAHQSSVTVAGPARNALVLRYARAIRSYIGAQVKDAQDADELAQEVLIRILRGDFAKATPERGRFRDLLKVAVRNMVRTFWTRKQRRASVHLDEALTPAVEDPDPSDDSDWNAAWRRSLLDMTWAALEAYQQAHKGSVSWTLLRLRKEYPEDNSSQLAARLSAATRQSFRAEAIRQQLRRARLRFAELLIEEIARCLDHPTPEAVEEELIEVGLMEYVRDFLPPDWRSRGELREVP
jgi:DNA-directed RNA polymerase specialized sigma24 family protein